MMPTPGTIKPEPKKKLMDMVPATRFPSAIDDGKVRGLRADRG